MKIKRAAKKLSPPSKDTEALIKRIQATSDDDLASVLRELPYWKYPRGDLQPWIPVFDKFDAFLEEIIKQYDLTKIQANEFTPKTKETLLEILRFQRMLMENCTQRKLFSSYDRMYDLLLTTDLDVLRAVLLVILRPAQQYATSTPFEPGYAAKFRQRLVVLSRGWEGLQRRGYDLASIVSSDDIDPDQSFYDVETSFYPASSSKLPASPSTSSQKPKRTPKSTSGETLVTVKLGNVSGLLTGDIPDRLASAVEDEDMPINDQLAVLNKLRITVSVRNKQERQKLQSIRLLAIAIYVLVSPEDLAQSSIFLYDPDILVQMSELLRAENVDDITTASTLFALDSCGRFHNRMQEIIPAIAPNISHGIIMSLYRSVMARLRSDRPPVHELVDAVLSFMSTLSNTGHGNVLVGAGILSISLEALDMQCQRRDSYIPRVTGLIDSFLMIGPGIFQTFNSLDGVLTEVARVKAEIDRHLNAILPEPSETFSEETIVTAATSPLKSLLRSLHRLMSSSGTGEGLRTLVDSDLPKWIKEIFENHSKFGHRIYASSINLMASFVHNEPTSLTVLQEIKLPNVLLENLEKNVPKSFDVMANIPTALGASCLNEVGLNYVKDHTTIIDNLIKSAIATSAPESHYMDRDLPHTALGKSLDELARHHPALRPTILQSALEVLTESLENARTWIPSAEQKKEYILEPGTSEPKSDEEEKKIPRNDALDHLMRCWTLLAGLLRNPTVCREFIEKDGLDMLSQSPDLPCIPVHMRGSDWAAVLGEVLRVIGEHDNARLVTHHIQTIEAGMSQCAALWKSDVAHQNWESLEGGSADQDLLDAFRKLRGLALKLYLLTNAFFSSFVHHRQVSAVIRAIGVYRDSPFVADLGKLQRVCAREHVQRKPIAKLPAPSTLSPPMIIGTDTDSTILAAARNETGVSKMATRLHSTAARVLKGFTRLLHVKRVPDANHRKEAEPLAQALADYLITNLQPQAIGEYETGDEIMGIGITSMMLFDDRSSEGNLNALLFTVFQKSGGIDRFISAACRILEEMDKTTEIPEDDRDDAQKARVVEATVGARLLLLVFKSLVTWKTFEGPQVMSLESRNEGSFQPVETLISLRLKILPIAQRVWNSAWLPRCPQNIIKIASQCFLIIMDGMHEDTSAPRVTVHREITHATPAVRPAPPVADPARVTQLVDMGFSRGAAEYALTRARNNVAAAADMILSMPHIFMNLEPSDPATAPTENSNSEASNGTTGESGGSGTVNAEASARPSATDQAFSNSDAETARPAAESNPAEPSATASTSNENTSPETAETVNRNTTPDKMDVDQVEKQESDLDQLKKMRESMQEDIKERALILIDSAEDLLFDLISAFPEGTEGLHFLLDQTLAAVTDYEDAKEKQVSARLRTLAVFMRASEKIKVDASLYTPAERIMDALHFPFTSKPRPKWTAVLMAFLEAFFSEFDVVKEAKLGDEAGDIENRDEFLSKSTGTIMKLAPIILADEEATRDEIVSSLRLLVVVTRHSKPNTYELEKILKCAKKPSAKFEACYPYLVMIIRHAIENPQVLENLMRSEIRHWLTPTRNRVSDVTHFVRQIRQVACRQPTIFVKAVAQECTLIDPTPPQSVYHIRGKADEKRSKKEDDPFADNTPPDSEVMSMLLSQLGESVKAVQEAEKEEEIDDHQSYSGLMLSILTELVGSYMEAKQSFVSSIRQQSLYPGSKSKSGLTAILNDMICGVNLSKDLASGVDTSSGDVARRLALSSWAMAFFVALCSDISNSPSLKEASADITSIRRTVLDAIIKVLKDQSSTDLGARYGRLWAISELIHRLLLAKPSVSTPQDRNDTSVQLAKLMLEKGFVGLLTSAIGEVDLNYPDIKVVLNSAMRALEHLTKMSIKWSKSGKGKDEGKEEAANAPSTDSEDSLSDSDIDMGSEDEAPDLYRNSALGMIGGDMRDDEEDYDEDGEEDDEMDDMMDEFDDGMDEDDGLDDDQTGTDPSMDDEEDHDIDEEDWTDEEEEDTNADHLHPVIEIGGESDEPLEEGLRPIWANPLDDIDEEDAFEEEHHMLDHDMLDHMEDDGFIEDEEGDEEDDFDMDEADYDEMEFMDEMPHTEAAHEGPSERELSMSWGWAGGRIDGSREGSERHSTSRLMDPTAAAEQLFGGPSNRATTSPTPAQNPLVTQPSALQTRTQRQLPRSLFSSLQTLLAGPNNGLGPGQSQSQALEMLEHILTRLGHHGSESVRVSVSAEGDGGIGLAIGNHNYNFGASSSTPPTSAQGITAEYVPKPTLPRWYEEMGVIPGSSQQNKWASLLVTHIVNRLLPDARKRAEEEAEKTREAEEEQAKVEAEKKVEDAKKREQETKLAATVALPESRASPAPPAPAPTSQEVEMPEQALAETEEVLEAPEVTMDEATTTAGAPETVADERNEVELPTANEASAAAEESLARTIIQIRGEDVDITDTGIDLEFLQALPDDMRADVVEQHMREQNRLRAPRDASTSAGQSTSGILPEFLDALPPEIRAEVVMQEAMENARRNPQPNNEPPPAQPRPNFTFATSTRPPASFLNSLTSELQDALMLGQPGGLLGGVVPMSGGPAGGSRRPFPPPMEIDKPKRESVQLLEKPGVASLVRLLFFPQTFKKEVLFKVLTNLCANSVTRSDLLNLLLSVIQDGSGDLPTVDKSFQQMSIKGTTTTPKQTPKKPEPVTPGPAASLFANLQTDNIPTFIAQRCFAALSYIVQSKSETVDYFLTEHEQPVGLKKASSKKGKGKDKILPQTKYPIVVLLGLLDRVNLLKAPGMMESFTALLVTITKPLIALKSDEDKEEPTPAANNLDVARSQESNAEDPKTPKHQAVEDKPKSSRTPNIPIAVLKLVVNCLTIGECSSKNFSQSLVVMQNLSTIAEAKSTILDEIKARSQSLGSAIQDELSGFCHALQDSDKNLESAALNVFSPPSSNQAQLLRLLKSIEYLHLEKLDSDGHGEELTDAEKALGQVYQTFDFDPLWYQLGNCLNVVREREDADQIALVLLPLVEALMVVCKYRSLPSREIRSPSIPTSATSVDSGDLFVSFTTAHRKVLNAIVRNNPSLLSGSFSLLIRNSKVLEFENKRNWFMQKLKRKRHEGSSGVLHLNVRRQYVFEDSFTSLRQRTGEEIRYGKLSVKFYNEDGIDAGGVTREWFTVLAQQIFDPNFALFEPCAADQQTYQPNKHSSVNGEHLAYFKFVGRVIGKAIYDNRLLNAYFNRAFYKQILGRSVDMRDLESIDPEYHKSLQWMLDNDITDIIDQEFTIEDDQFGEKTTVELKEGGAKIPVTEENKEEYVRLVVSYRLHNSIKDQVKAFLDGFYEVIPRKLVQIFEPDQLELLISGLSMVDVDELKNSTQLSGYKSSDPEITWFWRALRSFSQEERSRFLMFVTSSSRVPLGGFTQLVGASGIQPFQIQKLYAKPGSLPQASTCFNLLLLPSYDSYEQLKEKLVLAVEEGGTFGKS